jgi:hypothetical protein
MEKKMQIQLDVQIFVRIGLFILVTALHANAGSVSRPQSPGLEAGPAYHPPGLAYGAAFKDRILPIPIHEGLEEDGIWGADGVVPRDIHNGLEDPSWSYWGGKVLQGPDHRYHMITCRWPSDDPRGHGAWPESEIVYAVSAKPTGPFVYYSTVGKGHNPEIVRIHDGRFVIFHNSSEFYVSETLEGPWQVSDKQIVLDHNGMRPARVFNPTAAVRGDGSLILFLRNGGVYLSKSGSPEGPYKKMNDHAYPPGFEGKYFDQLEDPVIWRGPTQYHLIVNFWPTCQALYMRSLDGIHWVHEPGLAYDTSVTIHQDGTRMNWFKLEIPKVLQDQHGRATHFYTAAIDVIKNLDRGGDIHNSKNIAMPLVTERLISILNKEPIGAETKNIILKIRAEEDLDPQTDLDLKSLRLGAFQEVNYGRGAKPRSSKADGRDLIVEFDAAGHGLMSDNIAAKLLGTTKDNRLIIGYAVLPGQKQL